MTIGHDERIRRALVSVSDKRGLADLGRRLKALGVEIWGTGRTAETLLAEGIPCRRLEEVTGFPEILGGRVKTLHPVVAAGILARRDREEDRRALDQMGILPIDLVVVNLYPFVEATRRPGLDLPGALEEIDIGGSTLIRAAAKNHPWVAVLVRPDQYAEVLAEMEARGGALSLATRHRLAVEAFRLSAYYDAVVAADLARRTGVGEGLWEGPVQALPLERAQVLRYGENPHQRGVLCRDPAGGVGTIAWARQLQGKELSYTNLLDADSAWALVRDLAPTGCAIVKHMTPCGAAIAATCAEAWGLALATDPASAFGGIVAFTAPCDGEVARALAGLFLEVIVAPTFSEEARSALASKKGLRLLEVGPEPPSGWPGEGWEIRAISGGFLVQERDALVLREEGLRVVTERAPTAEESAALRLAWAVAKHVKSNAVVLASEGRTIGIGAGQMSRVDSVWLALEKARRAGLKTEGTAMASDGFFPFRDGIDAAASGGIRAVIQPGGSVRDEEVVRAANEAGMAMVLTGVRHFRH